MNKSRAADMRKVRQRRKDRGLVEFRAWVTPEQKRRFDELLAGMQPAENNGRNTVTVEAKKKGLRRDKSA